MARAPTSPAPAVEAPEARLARALIAIRRDGVLYAPDGDRPFVPVDRPAHAELAAIDAVEPTPWDELAPAADPGPTQSEAG